MAHSAIPYFTRLDLEEIEKGYSERAELRYSTLL
jgi:hypothetical protein